MLNETSTIIGAARIINETNITIEVSKILVESKNVTDIEYLSYLVPLMSIGVTGIIAILSIRANSRNILMQMHQNEIVNAIKELTRKIQSGNKENIIEFLESKNGIYVPTSIRKTIKKRLDSISEDDLEPNHIKTMKEVLTEYITKQKLFF